MAQWQDKVVLVTGGSRGLGRAVAEAFARRGAQVVVVARGQQAIDETVHAIRHAGHQASGVRGDVCRDEDAAKIVRHAVDQYGRLDVLINAAGRSSRATAIDTTPADFQALWEINFLATVRCTRAAVSELLKAHGHLVNIGSLAAKVAARYLGAYPASKFPLAAYCQQLRLELGPEGLHVLLVCPGPIARKQSRDRYTETTGDLPPAARKPAAGAKVRALDPNDLAERIITACQRRRAELIVPARARLLFAAAQLSPQLGDWLVKKMT
jgi:NAD(P)-dependent dehydrogenase (short-subunit alcohol dehydrogenase family)